MNDGIILKEFGKLTLYVRNKENHNFYGIIKLKVTTGYQNHRTLLIKYKKYRV